MLLTHCPPLKPFNPAYPRARFLQLDATLALNGVNTAADARRLAQRAPRRAKRHFAAASTSSPQPYDDLCTALLAYCGHTYRPLRWSREFQASSSSQRAVPTSPQSSLHHDLTSPATTTPASCPATSAWIPAPDHPPDEVQDVPASMNQSIER
ncbi:hypothetical protein HPB52_024100 [Rhipicephalus sanguineus]|uniref:Uncharacterized protein n=1 Tax=Rhipicephalus sanguineus TaxID=34632 RepID=A0A9D4PQT7_RHISA|nr:hypothetical protein HPB52_024100 [Rhipicephalus sanguineus]